MTLGISRRYAPRWKNLRNASSVLRSWHKKSRLVTPGTEEREPQAHDHALSLRASAAWNKSPLARMAPVVPTPLASSPWRTPKPMCKA